MPATRQQDLAHTARIFHALSDETRLRVIECLRECEQCVCDLTEILQIAQPRLSFHLKTLKDAGLLQDRREGRWIYYALNYEALQEAEELLNGLRPLSAYRRDSQRQCE